MSEHEQEQPPEEGDKSTDELLERQVGKGYGDDEGEREEALDDE